MSDMDDALEAKLAKDAELEKLRQDNAAKKTVIDSKRINFQMDQLKQNEKDLEIARNTSFGPMSEENINKLRVDNAEYIAAAKNPMTFICDTFKGIVPFFRKNLILIGGITGHGKSTTVANIAFTTIGQINPLTGKRRRVLILTNEEKAEDVYNRLTCLKNGWHYTNHDKFTPEQEKEFDIGIAAFPRNGLVTVIDNTYNGGNGMTTTLEGIQSIFDGLMRDKEYYDVVILDYYQNVKYSKRDTTLDEWKVQAVLANMLDLYKNSYPAPIVVMAQVKPQEKEGNTPFEYRIKGRKIITDPCTLILEMEANRETLTTTWTVWKSRFNESIGEEFVTGYDQGRFVVNNGSFQEKVRNIMEKRQIASVNSAIALKSEEDKEK